MSFAIPLEWRGELHHGAGDTHTMSDITRILHSIEDGDPKAADQLLPLVYEELRKLAAQRMASEAAGHTLQPTALVHEAWLRLAGEENQKWDGRGHFFAAAAESMRRTFSTASSMIGATPSSLAWNKTRTGGRGYWPNQNHENRITRRHSLPHRPHG